MNRSTLAALLLLAAPLAARAVPPDEMTARFEKKIAEPWFATGGWTADYDVARARAKETGRPILAYFTRSYAP